VTLANAAAQSKAPTSDDKTDEAPRRVRRRAEETRNDILAMAETLFRKRGFSAVAIADIAAALVMSPANVFKHFHSKTVLVDAIASRQLENLGRNLLVLDHQQPPFIRLLAMTRMLMQSHLRDLNDNPYIFEMILLMAKQELNCGQQYRNLIIGQIANIIGDGVAQGLYHTIDIHKTATTVANALAGVLHPVLIANEDPDNLATRCDQLVELIDAALRNNLAK
jgi:TetR/AcrR family transcriptional repressor of the ameABC operon